MYNRNQFKSTILPFIHTNKGLHEHYMLHLHLLYGRINVGKCL